MPTPPTTVTLSALDAGHLTLPENLFINPPTTTPPLRTTVPSLSFLLHHAPTSTHLLFDLGLKRDVAAYTPAQQHHIAQRQPLITSPDCAASLRAGGLDPATDVDEVILSHVHWDHVGTSADFPQARFVVGAGTLDVLARGAGHLYPRELFNADEVPRERTVELPPVPGGAVVDCDRRDGGEGRQKGEGEEEQEEVRVRAAPAEKRTKHVWERLAGLGAAVDYFGDGSVWVVDAPGHMYGHVNLLARVGERKWVYLGGDCCHDPRILSGEKGIAMYDDGRGGMRSVHVDTEAARGTLDRIQEFLREKKVNGEEAEVEVVVAHDKEWREKNRHKFFPGTF
ncbi:Cytochrome P450 monooxygenase mpaDE [Lasiodiplodia theobromae]|uniref:Cytochrome P450 monooxygenase mpaDE n=1 Tax=Lasiodiplodia theobromae TaxID=45133 RepID=A0A5N5CT73_9PEZI|nr:Cytochrome P450 monooxygenase mpaDE [Lasiodiplodia theobromae]